MVQAPTVVPELSRKSTLPLLLLPVGLLCEGAMAASVAPKVCHLVVENILAAICAHAGGDIIGLVMPFSGDLLTEMCP